jgi:hypothetical protein
MKFTNVILSNLNAEHCICYEIYTTMLSTSMVLSLVYVLREGGIFMSIHVRVMSIVLHVYIYIYIYIYMVERYGFRRNSA